MRILITTGIFPPDIGGPATYSFCLANVEDSSVACHKFGEKALLTGSINEGD